ncbi:hypothetical protein [Caulobacter sp. NIBR1757]|uniref:hypothetical protein n=1 Tax=Caulobacter sp. NIBR1757 TaxID=3016000 RepID=UPI0022F07689|nr:hypothetical protein [Caulobacter sp. NIBR1757]WGM39439.1 hypothetical protein AMEJIAPC_02359 [Caulobacter sp. NIBR1757]
MTVEVLLMNRTAVAMAADSAVTITSDQPPYQISQTGVVKTFVLSGRTPSGMMIFASAEFCGCPWSTVVDHMRGQGLGGEATLADTVAGFMSRLNGLCNSDLVEAGDGVMTFRIFAVQAIADFRRAADQIGEAHPSLRPDEVLTEAVGQLEHEVGTEAAWVDGELSYVQRERIGTETPRLKAIIDDNLDNIVGLALDAFFEGQVIGPDVRLRLAAAVRTGLITSWMPSGARYTGVVIAGFGADEVSPAYIELHVMGLIGDLLKYRIADAERVGRDNPVVVRSFAQNGAVDRFLYGADEEFTGEAFRRVAILTMSEIERLKTAAGKTGDAEFWGQVDQAVMQSALLGLYSTRLSWREAIEASFDQKVRTASVGPLGDLAGQLLSLPLTESEMMGNMTVARPFSILRLSKAGAVLSHPTEP